MITNEIFNEIATEIWRSTFIEDKNKIRQQGAERITRLIVSNLISKFKDKYPEFNEKEFYNNLPFFTKPN